jgi:hypothetical protein
MDVVSDAVAGKKVGCGASGRYCSLKSQVEKRGNTSSTQSNAIQLGFGTLA